MFFGSRREALAHADLLHVRGRVASMAGRMGVPEIHFEGLNRLENTSPRAMMPNKPVNITIGRLNIARHGPYISIGLLFISSLLSANMMVNVIGRIEEQPKIFFTLFACFCFTTFLGLFLSQCYSLSPFKCTYWTIKDFLKAMNAYQPMPGAEGSFAMCKKDGTTMCGQLTAIRDFQNKFLHISKNITSSRVPTNFYKARDSFHYNLDCPYCLESVNNGHPTVILSCSHACHAACLSTGMSFSNKFECVICRVPISTDEILLSVIVKSFDNTMFNNIKRLEDILKNYFSCMSPLFVSDDRCKAAFTDCELFEPVESLFTVMMVVYLVGCIVMSNMLRLTIAADISRTHGREQEIIQGIIENSRFINMLYGKDSDVFHKLFETFCPGTQQRMERVHSLMKKGMLIDYHMIYYLLGGRMLLVDVRKIFETVKL